MNYKPIADRVIIQPNDTNEITPGGIYIPETAKEKSQLGKVVAVGAGRIDNGTKIPMDCVVGDTVLYGKYSGTEIVIDDVTYLIMKENEILAIQND